MYKYLLFDLDETLLDFKKAEAKTITSVLKKYGILADNNIVELYSAINNSCWKRYEKGEITRNEIYSERTVLLGEKLGVYFDTREFSNNYFRTLSQHGQTFPYAFTLLSSLRKKGYTMAAATNGALIAQSGRIINSGLAGFFNGGIYISEQIGHKKPEVEFFDFIMNSMGIKNKRETLVIGDSPSSDIAGAIASKIDCCLVNLRKSAIPKDCNPTFTVSNLEDIITVCGL